MLSVFNEIFVLYILFQDLYDPICSVHENTLADKESVDSVRFKIVAPAFSVRFSFYKPLEAAFFLDHFAGAVIKHSQVINRWYKPLLLVNRCTITTLSNQNSDLDLFISKTALVFFLHAGLPHLLYIDYVTVFLPLCKMRSEASLPFWFLDQFCQRLPQIQYRCLPRTVRWQNQRSACSFQ